MSEAKGRFVVTFSPEDLVGVEKIAEGMGHDVAGWLEEAINFKLSDDVDFLGQAGGLDESVADRVPVCHVEAPE